ncbi:hypothetical protein Tsubulata_049387, partial [Turnera subulata]
GLLSYSPILYLSSTLIYLSSLSSLFSIPLPINPFCQIILHNNRTKTCNVNTPIILPKIIQKSLLGSHQFVTSVICQPLPLHFNHLQSPILRLSFHFLYKRAACTFYAHLQLVIVFRVMLKN